MNVAIITGASRGIGNEIAKKLAPEYKVINLSRTVIADIESYQIDVANPEHVSQVFTEIVKKHGVPTILINNAGFVDPKGLLEISYKSWIKTINTNLTGTFLCTQEFVKYTKNIGGKIINIASTAGTRPQPGWSAYAASKAGIINFSLSMSEELKPYNIKVYCLSPGRCATGLRKILAPDEDQRKIMQPKEVADFVYILLKNGKLIDGQNIIIKGGN